MIFELPEEIRDAYYGKGEVDYDETNIEEENHRGRRSHRTRSSSSMKLPALNKDALYARSILLPVVKEHHHPSDWMRRYWLVARSPPGTYHETAPGSASPRRQAGRSGTTIRWRRKTSSGKTSAKQRLGSTKRKRLPGAMGLPGVLEIIARPCPLLSGCYVPQQSG